MRSLPLPLRVVAGLAATAVEQARDLPAKLAGLPVTVASQALQMSMRVQQHVTELAIKGDEVLSVLRPVEETPDWATFDEDLAPEAESDLPRAAPFDQVVDNGEDDDLPEIADLDLPTNGNGHVASPESRAAVGLAGLGRDLGSAAETAPDPWALEERALAEETEERTAPEPVSPPEPGATLPAGLANYDDLSLPQLRARLRRFSTADLEALLAHERTHRNRPEFVGMLTRRIATLHNQR